LTVLPKRRGCAGAGPPAVPWWPVHVGSLIADLCKIAPHTGRDVPQSAYLRTEPVELEELACQAMTAFSVHIGRVREALWHSERSQSGLCCVKLACAHVREKREKCVLRRTP